MKTIMFFSESLGGGGKERRMGELIRSLKQHGDFKIHVVLYSNVIDYNQVCSSIDSIHYINEKEGRYQRLKFIYKLIKEIKPDYVHVWTARVCLYINLIYPFLRFRYIFSSIADANKPSFKNQILLYNTTYRICDSITSNSMAGLIAYKAPLKKSVVIYNGFNQDRLNPNETGENVRKEFNLDGKKVITMAARLDKSKDFEMFIDIAKEIDKKIANTLFLIVGRGEKEDVLKQYAKEHDVKNVIFCGYRKDVEAIYKASDIAVLCTNAFVHAEGVSNSIMEGMACGLPVVATEGGGTNEIIVDGYNGYIVQPKDVNKAVERISELITDNDTYRKLCINAQKTIKEKFTIEEMTKGYIKEYK
ncbi:MAG: glycosyltransferase [Bacteroidaceae bacterium]|nr:glycosyltransferase [Bacteroidaceae bacterium]